MRWGRSKMCGYCTCYFANIYVWVLYFRVCVCVSVGRVLVHVLKSWICISILLNFRFVVCHVVLCGFVVCYVVVLWSWGVLLCGCVVLCLVIVWCSCFVAWYLWYVVLWLEMLRFSGVCFSGLAV